jgi:hypothetical protein
MMKNPPKSNEVHLSTGNHMGPPKTFEKAQPRAAIPHFSSFW